MCRQETALIRQRGCYLVVVSQKFAYGHIYTGTLVQVWVCTVHGWNKVTASSDTFRSGLENRLYINRDVARTFCDLVDYMLLLKEIISAHLVTFQEDHLEPGAGWPSPGTCGHYSGHRGTPRGLQWCKLTVPFLQTSDQAKASRCAV